MKKVFAILVIFFGMTKGFSQNVTVYEIEKLSAPKKFLVQKKSQEIFMQPIEKYSPLPDSLVTFGEHSFLEGVLSAYKQHRPIVLSPDVVWLLINQGFANHIVNNSEKHRKDFVDFDGKKKLTVIVDTNIVKIKVGNPNSNWEYVFPQFSQLITENTNKEIVDILTADFTTTTSTTKIVSTITIMETFKNYFDYEVALAGCGIPKVTIEGTVEDWEKVLAKTQYLSKYDLKWWVSELEPILQNIIKAKKGEFNKKFWMNMIKAHTKKAYGNPTTIDGWILKFFPYTKNGKQTDLKPITDINGLASEIVRVPFVLIDGENRYEMEFWAGFFGLSQSKDFTLKPEIGWAVSKATKKQQIDNFFDKF